MKRLQQGQTTSAHLELGEKGLVDQYVLAMFSHIDAIRQGSSARLSPSVAPDDPNRGAKWIAFMASQRVVNASESRRGLIARRVEASETTSRRVPSKAEVTVLVPVVDSHFLRSFRGTLLRLVIRHVEERGEVFEEKNYWQSGKGNVMQAYAAVSSFTRMCEFPIPWSHLRFRLDRKHAESRERWYVDGTSLGAAAAVGLAALVTGKKIPDHWVIYAGLSREEGVWRLSPLDDVDDKARALSGKQVVLVSSRTGGTRLRHVGYTKLDERGTLKAILATEPVGTSERLVRRDTLAQLLSEAGMLDPEGLLATDQARRVPPLADIRKRMAQICRSLRYRRGNGEYRGPVMARLRSLIGVMEAAPELSDSDRELLQEARLWDALERAEHASNEEEAEPWLRMLREAHWIRKGAGLADYDDWDAEWHLMDIVYWIDHECEQLHGNFKRRVRSAVKVIEGLMDELERLGEPMPRTPVARIRAMMEGTIGRLFLHCLSDLKRAETWLNAAISHFDDDPTWRFESPRTRSYLVNCLRRQDRVHDALEVLATALHDVESVTRPIDPDYADTTSLFLHYEGLRCLVHAGKYEEALQGADELLKMDVPAGFLIPLLLKRVKCWAYTALGRIEQRDRLVREMRGRRTRLRPIELRVIDEAKRPYRMDGEVY